MRGTLPSLLALLFVALTNAQGQNAPQLSPAKPTGEIGGRVVDEPGGTLPGAFVSAVRVEPIARPIVASTVATKEGTFRLAELRPGRYLVIASATGFASQTTTVDVTDRRVELPPLALPIAVVYECIGGAFVVRNPEGQGIPGARLQEEASDGSLTFWGRLDSRGQSECGLPGSEVFVIDAPGYGRHRVRRSYPAVGVVVNVAPELLAAAAESFAPSIPDVPLQAGEVVVGVATTAGDFMIALNAERLAYTEANVRAYVDSNMPEDGRFRVVTGVDVVRAIQSRSQSGQKPMPPVTIIAIKRAR